MVGQLSGKAGSTVASRNRNGSYIRTRVSPMLVQNQYTDAVRSSFTDLAQRFRTLTAAQIAAWNALGTGITRSNSIGQPYTLTGLQAYLSINRNLQTISQDYIDTPPQNSAPQAPTSFNFAIYPPHSDADTTVTVGATDDDQNVGSTEFMEPGMTLWFGSGPVVATVLSITDATHVKLTASITTVTADDVVIAPNGWLSLYFFPHPVPTDEYYALAATPPMSPGINRPTKNAYKTFFVMPPATSSPDELYQVYQPRLGSVAVGQKVFMTLKSINTNGLASGQVAYNATAQLPRA